MSNKDKQDLDAWAKENIEIGKLDLRDLKLGRDYALFGFWLLTAHLKKMEAIHRHSVYYYLTKLSDLISVTSQAFSRAVLDDEKEDFFRKNGDKHFLTPHAIALVEGWCAGEAVASTKPVKEEKKA